MSQPTDYAVIEAMRVYGGSFVRMLGELCLLADPVNLAKLKTAFPELWEKFSEVAEMRAEKGEGPK